jgi:hypothetical protein
MGKVLWHTPMAVDGFLAGPGDALSRVFKRRLRQPADGKHVTVIGANIAEQWVGEGLRRNPGPPRAFAWETASASSKARVADVGTRTRSASGSGDN